MQESVITNDFEETRAVGFELAHNLNGKNILALRGDLGAGKTTFVQGLAQGLGITQNIISPTFIIMRTYEIGDKNSPFAKASEDKKDLGFKNFYHVDLYRIETEKDVEGLGLLEIMKDPENLVAIEWPEKIENLLPEKRCDILFTYLDDSTRAIVIDN